MTGESRIGWRRGRTWTSKRRGLRRLTGDDAVEPQCADGGAGGLVHKGDGRLKGTVDAQGNDESVTPGKARGMSRACCVSKDTDDVRHS